MGRLELDLLADVVRATVDNGGGNVARIPPYHVAVGLQGLGSSMTGTVCRFAHGPESAADQGARATSAGTHGC
jgi:hypothetical protein